jgi:hypothetical protein
MPHDLHSQDIARTRRIEHERRIEHPCAVGVGLLAVPLVEEIRRIAGIAGST